MTIGTFCVGLVVAIAADWVRQITVRAYIHMPEFNARTIFFLMEYVTMCKRS